MNLPDQLKQEVTQEQIETARVRLGQLVKEKDAVDLSAYKAPDGQTAHFFHIVKNLLNLAVPYLMDYAESITADILQQINERLDALQTYLRMLHNKRFIEAEAMTAEGYLAAANIQDSVAYVLEATKEFPPDVLWHEDIPVTELKKDLIARFDALIPQAKAIIATIEKPKEGELRALHILNGFIFKKESLLYLDETNEQEQQLLEMFVLLCDAARLYIEKWENDQKFSDQEKGVTLTDMKKSILDLVKEALAS